MFVVGLLGWWYGTGWRRRLGDVRERLVSTMDYFSIDLLLGTLFSPFRQISAGHVQGPLVVQFRALFDNLLSRLIGAAVRITVIGVGIMAILLTAVGGILLVITWALVPVLPLVGVVLTAIGWLPWTR